MNIKNRIDRLSSILTLLSDGSKLSTPTLSKIFEVSNKIIQTDFKEYLLPLFDDDTIYYDYSTKSYRSNNFLIKTLLTADELSIIAILKNKSKDKYSDENLSQKVNLLFKKYERNLTKNNSKKIEKFDHTIDNCFKAELEPIQVKLFLDKNISDFFIKKPISKTQKILKKYEDDSYVIELYITNIIDIIPTIQKNMPHIGVLAPIELKNTLKRNLYHYLKNYD